MIEQRPINMDKVREKLEKLKNPGAFKKNPDKWTPKSLAKGETKGEVSTLRLIRNPFDEDPFVVKEFHFGVGRGEKSTFLCLKRNYGKDCPVCDFASKLWNSGSDVDKAQAKKLFAKTRQNAIVVDRADEVPTPRYWGFGVKVYNELVEKLEHKSYAGFMDYYKGIDIEVSYTKTDVSQEYPNTTLTFSRDNTVLAESDGDIQKILDQIKKPEEVFQPLTRTEIEDQLQGWIGSDKSAEAQSSETVKGGNGSAATVDDVTEDKVEEKPMTEADVDDAFASLVPEDKAEA